MTSASGLRPPCWKRNRNKIIERQTQPAHNRRRQDKSPVKSLRASVLIGVIWCVFNAGANLLTITNTADSGATDANADPPADIISFNISGSGAQTITLSTALQDVFFFVTIDGSTQPDYAGT